MATLLLPTEHLRHTVLLLLLFALLLTFTLDMSPKRRISPKGFLTFNTHFHRGFFIPENYFTDSQTDVTIIRSSSQPSVNSSKREGSNETRKSARSTQPLRLEIRSCPSIRRLQAKMEIEKHQVKETMEQLLNTEKHFIKELEGVLKQHDIAEQRRRELLHKHWTERLWLPFQKQLNQRVSVCGAAEIKRRQGLYNQYLQHCNNKGYVFLDTYNPKEYDPLLLHSEKCHYMKQAEIKNIPKEAWTSNYLETGLHGLHENSSREDNKLPHRFQSSLTSSSFATRGTRHGTPSSYSASTATKTPTETKAARRAPSRYSFYRFTDSVKDLRGRGQDKPNSMSPSGSIRSLATLTQSTDSYRSD